MRALDFAWRAFGLALIQSSSRASVRSLRLVLLAFDFEPLVLLLEPGGIAAVIGNALPAIELERPFGDVVEEVAVMGDHDHGAGIVAQMMLEPSHALGVEMVGRLVEQENVGLGEQQLAKRDAALLAA